MLHSPRLINRRRNLKRACSYLYSWKLNEKVENQFFYASYVPILLGSHCNRRPNYRDNLTCLYLPQSKAQGDTSLSEQIIPPNKFLPTCLISLLHRNPLIVSYLVGPSRHSIQGLPNTFESSFQPIRVRWIGLFSVWISMWFTKNSTEEILRLEVPNFVYEWIRIPRNMWPLKEPRFRVA